VYNWNGDLESSSHHHYGNFIVFASAAISAFVLFLILHPEIAKLTRDSPILIDIMFVPIFVIGFIYGLKIVERVIKPSDPRGSFMRSIVKIFLLFFIIGGLFSSVNFALQGGTLVPSTSIFEIGLIPWITDFVSNNGGITFLIISSITLMAAATKRIVGLDGFINKVITFIGTFFFFSMIALSFSNSDPTDSQVYLYVFYQAGIITGALYHMNKLTSNLNMWEDLAKGYR
jgi:hypothetical protein